MTKQHKHSALHKSITLTLDIAVDYSYVLV